MFAYMYTYANYLMCVTSAKQTHHMVLQCFYFYLDFGVPGRVATGTNTTKQPSA